jgi:hypothetical protein
MYRLKPVPFKTNKAEASTLQNRQNEILSEKNEILRDKNKILRERTNKNNATQK